MLSDLLAHAAARPAHEASYAPTTHDQLLDDVLRIGWTGECEPDGDPVLATTRATVVVVSSDPPDAVLDTANTSFRKLTPSGTAPRVLEATPPRFTQAVAGLRAQRPAGAADEEYVDLLLAGPEVSTAEGLPALYLATTILGGYPRSRLSSWCRQFDTRVVDLVVGRDRLGAHGRVYARVRAPARLATGSVAAVLAHVEGLVREPPSCRELVAAADYAHRQLQSAFDSPRSLADALRHTLSSGRSLDWLLQRSALLREVQADEVAVASAAYLALGHSAVSIGLPHEEALRAAVDGALLGD